MNKLVVKFAGLFVFVLLVSLSAITSGCNKEIDCMSGDVTLTSTTDGSGTANFETNLPMILDIFVNGQPTGRVARFEDDKTDNVTVQM